MSITANFPTIRPTLNLDFANSRTVDPRITFTRASTATYFDRLGVLRTAAVNEPRIDYDPATGECKGLLIEEQRTNLLTYSEDFTQGYWGKHNGTVVTNVGDGFYKVERGASASSNVMSYIVALNTNYAPESERRSHYFIIKRGNTRYVYITTKNDFIHVNDRRAIFDLDTLSVTSSDFGSSGFIRSLGNDVFMIGVNLPTSTVWGGVAENIGIGACASPTDSRVGNVGDYVLVKCAQTEKGAFPTSYIPTNGTQVTRAADNAVMTGTNFSSWYRQDEGTLFAEASTLRTSEYGEIFQIGENGGANRLDIGVFGPSGHSTVVANNSHEAVWDDRVAINTNKYANGAYAKAVLAYKFNDTNTAINGVAGTTDTVCVVPVVSLARIGFDSFGRYLNGTIRRIAYYPARLPNAQLQAITA